VSVRIDWTDLQCDKCSDPATHVLVDDVDWEDDIPHFHRAYCDDHYCLYECGTVWVHWEEGDG
jgi:hypothetical protein